MFQIYHHRDSNNLLFSAKQSTEIMLLTAPNTIRYNVSHYHAILIICTMHLQAALSSPEAIIGINTYQNHKPLASADPLLALNVRVMFI